MAEVIIEPRCFICGDISEDYAVHILEPLAAVPTEATRELIGDEPAIFTVYTCRRCDDAFQERLGPPLPASSRGEIKSIFETMIAIDQLPTTERP